MLQRTPNPSCGNKVVPALLYRLKLAGLMALLLTLALTIRASAALANRKISDIMPAFGYVEEFQISPDGLYVVYLADQETDEIYELYSVALPNGNPIKVNGPLANGDVGVVDFQISPDSSRVVYVAHQDTANEFELYSVPLDGSDSPVKLNNPLVSGGKVDSDFQISPDSSRVVYLADQETDEVYELYTVPLDGSSVPVKLNGLLVGGGDVSFDFQINPDSSRMVYVADQETDEVYELYTVPLDGSSAPVKLNGLLVDGGDVSFGVQISPDSSRVVYMGDQETDEVYELYSVLLDGSSLPIKLNDPPVSEGDVAFFEISPDSSQVVYVGDQDADEVRELYSVPLVGGSLPVKLNGSLVSGGDITHFQISPNSSRVVYRADQQTNDMFEIGSVPLTGGSPVRLNAPLVSGGDVEFYFQISLDSSWVVYVGDQDTDEVRELYRVPLAGGPAPVKLNSLLVSGGDVTHFQISPNSNRVVYRADQQTDNVEELYSMPLSGGPAPVKLSGALVSGGTVAEFQISPDSSRVVYSADQETDEVVELFLTYEETPLLNFSTAAATVPEGAGTATAVVQLSETLTATVQIDYSVTGGTATGGGVDYSLADGTLLFAPGVITQPIEITLVDDTEPEMDETVVIGLSNPQDSMLAAPAVFILTIPANDGGDEPPVFPVYLPLILRE